MLQEINIRVLLFSVKISNDKGDVMKKVNNTLNSKDGNKLKRSILFV